MKTGQSKGDVLTWDDIREIWREANSLSTLLPDTGRCTKTQLPHVDAVVPTPRVRGSNDAVRDTAQQAPVGGNSLPSFAE